MKELEKFNDLMSELKVQASNFGRITPAMLRGVKDYDHDALLLKYEALQLDYLNARLRQKKLF